MSTANPSGRRPNIILIMTDQQRYDQIGYASSGGFDTPHLDRLAGQGIIFENAYSTATVCVPSRGSLLTGILHHRLPTVDVYRGTPDQTIEFLALREGFWTVPHCLRAAGYRTALIGKMHFYPIRARHGFDHMQTCEHLTEYAGYRPGDMDDYHTWLMWNGRADWRGTHMFSPDQKQLKSASVNQPFPYEAKFHPTNWVADQSVRFLREHPSGEPFFLVCSFRHPHTPYDPPEPYASMFKPADVQVPSGGRSVNESLPSPFRDQMLAFRPAAERSIQQVVALIRGLVKQIDDGVGEILKEVDLDNTYVFFTSDHGDYSGHRGLLGKNPWLPFEDLSRVPFFCAGPAVPGGKRITELVQNYDFAMTALDLAGVRPPAPVFDAVSLRPYFDGGGVGAERIVYCSTTPILGCAMVRRGHLKYLWGSANGAEMLFDLAEDPAESRSVAGEARYAQELEQLRHILRDCLSRKVPELQAFNG